MTTTTTPKHKRRPAITTSHVKAGRFSRNPSVLHKPSNTLRLATCLNCMRDLYAKPGEEWLHNHNHHDQCVYTGNLSASPDPATVVIGRYAMIKVVTVDGVRGYMTLTEAAYSPRHRATTS